MKKGVIICVGMILMWNCRQAQKPATAPEVDSNAATAKMTSAINMGCYIYKEDGNSVHLEVTSTANPVQGKLQYQFAEKDRNTGTFTGNFKDGKLIGTYTFMSEGTESKREVAFLLKKGQLIEGYGEMDDNGTAFKDRESISFSSSMPLSYVKCPL